MYSASVRLVRVQFNTIQVIWRALIELSDEDFLQLAKDTETPHETPLVFRSGEITDQLDIDDAKIRRIVIENSRNASYVSIEYVVFPIGMFDAAYFEELKCDKTKTIYDLLVNA